jgi:hypothetical protein
MDNEIKWFMIMIMVVVIGMCVAAGIGEYSTHQCKIAFAQSTRPIDEIEKICK